MHKCHLSDCARSTLRWKFDFNTSGRRPLQSYYTQLSINYSQSSKMGGMFVAKRTLPAVTPVLEFHRLFYCSVYHVAKSGVCSHFRVHGKR